MPVQRLLIHCLFAVMVITGVVTQRAAAQAIQLLPDFVVWADETHGFQHGWTINTTQIPGRTLLKLTAAVANIGQGPIELRGGPISADRLQDVYQRIYLQGGGFDEVYVGTFEVGQFGNMRLLDWAQFQLREITPGNGVGDIVASFTKNSICLLDVLIYEPMDVPGTPPSQVYGACGATQGISVGWTDVYYQTLADMRIDITDVLPGNYWLEVTYDPLNRLQEVDETNNTTRIQIQLGEAQDPVVSAMPEPVVTPMLGLAALWLCRRRRAA